MAEFWTSPEAVDMLPKLAARMNSIDKLVVSSTLHTVTWANTEIESNDAEVVLAERATREQLLILGSPTLVATLATAGVLDELRVMVNPVLIGRGKSLFGSSSNRLDLHLLHSRIFDSGNVLLTYQPTGQQK
jgi:dihydrofolate reductase